MTEGTAGAGEMMGTRSGAMTRRRFLKTAAAAALMLRVGDGPMLSRARPLTIHAQRAIAAYNALQMHLYRPSLFPGETLPLYLDQTPQNDTNPYSFSWPFSQAAEGTVDMLLGLPDGRQIYLGDAVDRANAAELYWTGNAYSSYITPPTGPGGAVFYDDSVWLGLNALRHHKLTGDRRALRRADGVFRFLVSGWDTDPSHAVPGGVFWVAEDWNRDRNTCQNGAGAELGARLYQLTGDTYYLDWAKKMYDWPRRALLDPSGVYYDHMGLEGNIDGGMGAYNQGVMIGAGALLYQITHEPAYLAQAKTTATATLRYFAKIGYGAHNPAYVTIFFRNMLFWSTVDRSLLTQTLQAMKQYADECWLQHRNERNLFSFPGDKGTTPLRAQGAMATLYACLAADPAVYDSLL